MSNEQSLASAIALHRRGSLREAEAAYRRILAVAPDYAEAHNALGIALQQQGNAEGAVTAFRRAATLKPDYAAAQANLGAALQRLGRIDEAAAAHGAAIALDPTNPDYHYNLALVRQGGGDLDAAAAQYRAAIALRPGHAGAHNNLGTVLRMQGRLDQAIAAYRTAIAHDPSSPYFRYNHAQVALMRGDFAVGWSEHEFRFAAGIAHERHGDLPRWCGDRPAGRTILVWAEQGLGDSIQFGRYLPLLGRLGARVVFEVQAALGRLCGNIEGITVVVRDRPLPVCDLQVPLMSLPYLMGTTVQTIPGDVPYLLPTEGSVARWRDRLGPRLRPRVALVWAGSPGYADDGNRSLPVELIAGMTATHSAIDFYSFQFGPAALKSAATGPDGMIDLADELGDFESTAGALTQMDLLISADTSALHLGGAMGMPVWALLPFAPDWRWLDGRDDCPWYPSLRLFRQRQPRQWRPVLDRVSQELRRLFDTEGQAFAPLRPGSS